MAVTTGKTAGARSQTTYGVVARSLHWLMAILILLQIASGLVMAQGGPQPNIWSTIIETLRLYDWHKSLGVLLLLLVVIRIAWRIGVGAPQEEPTLPTWQREVSGLTHGWLYLGMIVVPLLGWVGISLFPALVVFGSYPLPALMPPDQAAAGAVFAAHAITAYVLIALIVMHVGAALYHHLIRRDGVLARMWPGLGRRADRQ